VIYSLALEVFYHPVRAGQRLSSIDWREFSKIYKPNQFHGFHNYGKQNRVNQRFHIDCKGKNRIKRNDDGIPNEQHSLCFFHPDISYSTFFVHSDGYKLAFLAGEKTFKKNDVLIFCNEPHHGVFFKEGTEANRTYFGNHGEGEDLALDYEKETQEFYFDY
jgi:hypothetical protein